MFLVRIRCNERVVNRVWVETLEAARVVAWQIQNRLAWEGQLTEVWIVEVLDPALTLPANPPPPQRSDKGETERDIASP